MSHILSECNVALYNFSIEETIDEKSYKMEIQHDENSIVANSIRSENGRKQLVITFIDDLIFL